MSYIGKIPATGNFVKLDAISVVNGQASYTMQSGSVNFTPESANHMLVSLNGVIQAPQTSFSVSGSTITFASALSTGDVINFIMVYGNVLDIGTPSDDTISASKLQTDSVIEAKIQNNAVTTDKINNDAVTIDKINLISTTSAPSLEAKGTSGQTDGYIQLNCEQNTHGIKLKSPPHSAGQSYTLTFPSTAPATDKFLKTDNSGNLSFADAGGGLVKLSSTTLSSTASQIDFTSSIISSTYDAYYFTILFSPETDNANLQVLLSDGGSFNTGSSDYGYGYLNDSGSGTSSNGDDKIKLFDATDSNIANAYQGELTLLYPSNASTKTCVNFAGNRNDGHTSIMIGGGQRLNAEATDGIRFKANSGDMSIGTSITCYGIVK